MHDHVGLFNNLMVDIHQYHSLIGKYPNDSGISDDNGSDSHSQQPGLDPGMLNRASAGCHTVPTKISAQYFKHAGQVPVDNYVTKVTSAKYCESRNTCLLVLVEAHLGRAF